MQIAILKLDFIFYAKYKPFGEKKLYRDAAVLKSLRISS